MVTGEGYRFQFGLAVNRGLTVAGTALSRPRGAGVGGWLTLEGAERG